MHVAEAHIGEIFLPGRSAKLESAFSDLPGAVVDLRYGWDLAAAGRQECWRTLHAESSVGDWIAAEWKALTWVKDERETRLQRVKHLNFCCAVYRWQLEREGHFLHEHPRRASSWDLDCLKAVTELPGRGRGAMRSALVWHGGALASEAQMSVDDLNQFVTVQQLEETPAVLSLGTLCKDHGYSYEWVSGQEPRLTQNGKSMIRKTDNFVPLVVPRLSVNSSSNSP